MKTKIYYVSASLTDNGIAIQTRAIEGEFKKVCFVSTNKRIPKSDFGTPRTKYYEHLGVPIAYYTYAEYNMIKDAKEVLTDKIRAQVAKFSQQLNGVVANLNKGCFESSIEI